MTPMSSRTGQRGVALVIVLWLLVLLSVMALGFSRSMHSDVRTGLARLATLQAVQLAEAAIQRALFDLLTTEPGQHYRLLQPGREEGFRLGNAELHYRIEDERGKVDLNKAPAELIAGLLHSLGVAPEQAGALTDAILDWRDPNDQRRLNGAEEAEYAAAGLAGLPPNRPFLSVQELQQVLGMDDGLYRRLLPYVTIHSFSKRINPLTAPREVLLALPAADPMDVAMAIGSREAALDGGPAPTLPSLAGMERWFIRASGPVYTVIGRATLESGAVAARRMVIMLDGKRSRKLYHVLDSFPAGTWEQRREDE